MKTKLERIAEIAKEKPKERFTSLAHLLEERMLMQCHKEINGNKATGIDRVTKAEYEQELDSNIKELVTKLKRRAYRHTMRKAPGLHRYLLRLGALP